MSNDQQPDRHAQGPQPGSWGGEYDAEATAFIELPGGYAEEPGGEPLAAPGHGFQPPELGRTGGTPPATAGATTDPGETGQWTMPFAWGDPPPEGTAAPSRPSRAAAMGQGAAALAGGRRRPGEGADGEQAGHDASPWTAGPEGVDAPRSPAPWSAQPDGEPHPAEAAPAVGGATVTEPVETGPASGAGDPAPAAPPVPEDAVPAPGGSRSEHPEVSYVLRVNGVDRPVSGAWIGESLLYVLRERLGLAGAKDGCAQGECGACSVQVDGRLVAACLVPAATAAGSEIRTVEGLGGDGAPSDVQRALAASAVQCGFCLPGMAMTVHDLLEGNHAPTELETRQALCGNLCRCTGYRGVLDAVRTVVEERAALAARQEHAERAEPGAAPAEQDAALRIPHQPGPPAGGM
ncbi:2Fe-2S iron-sulfur cluster-binding protein [Streptomyces sp. DSM 44938]|uniref:2Fe-2S iron-sulfur cluster-binding protein n=1 Tax=Streptomyces litchfieldiae TaxID=3075543 RepID=A0ABU2MQX1_9ACTN|nr:2Fe-2S iron-sulfur cluster-binding protein [Streptomyces sp. DSM 44938]MDT0342999.1 2Fe-2S iron-sulfur cluster-binding protein [Streptomyces sp. DSM 44938]